MLNLEIKGTQIWQRTLKYLEIEKIDNGWFKNVLRETCFAFDNRTLWNELPEYIQTALFHFSGAD